MTSALAPFRPSGPRVRGPAVDVVRVTGGLAVVFDRIWWSSPALTTDLTTWWDRLAHVSVPGVAPLVARAPGVFVYRAPAVHLLRELLGEPAGVRAGLELVLSAGELLAARPVGPHAGFGPDFIGIDQQGMAQLFGWRLPPVDVLQYLDEPDAVPDDAAQHAPPERFTGAEEDDSGDLYALVASAAMWMTGRPLFADQPAERARNGEAERAVAGLGLPGAVVELFSMALAAEPRERPSPAAFLDEIEALIDGADGTSADRLAAQPLPRGDASAWWDSLSRDLDPVVLAAQRAASEADDLLEEAGEAMDLDAPRVARMVAAAQEAAREAHQRADDAHRAWEAGNSDASRSASAAAGAAVVRLQKILEEAVVLFESVAAAPDFDEEDTAPRDDAETVARREVVSAGWRDAERLDVEVASVGTPAEAKEARAHLANARAALEADSLDLVDGVADAVGSLSVLRAGIEVRLLEAARAAAEKAATQAANTARVAASRATVEEVLAAAVAEAVGCADDPAVAQLLSEIRAGVSRTLDAASDGSPVRAERALEAARRVRARIGPVVAGVRERRFELRAAQARQAAEDAEQNLARIAAACRVAEAAAERIERAAEQVGRPLDKLVPEVADVRETPVIAEAVRQATANFDSVGVQLNEVRKLAIEVEFCSDPADAEERLGRLIAVADAARNAISAVESSVATVRKEADLERGQQRRSRIVEVRETASAEASAVGPLSAEVEAARLKLAAALEGEVFPSEVRGAITTWETALTHLQRHRNTLAEAMEVAEAEGPAARISSATKAAKTAGVSLVTAIERAIQERERGRLARQRRSVEPALKAARAEARRGIAAADGSAAAADREAARAELEALAAGRAAVRQAQRELDAAAEGRDPAVVESLCTLLSVAAGDLVARAAEVDRVSARARKREAGREERPSLRGTGPGSARQPVSARLRALRASVELVEESTATNLTPLATEKPEPNPKEAQIRGVAGGDKTDLIYRRSLREALEDEDDDEDEESTSVFAVDELPSYDDEGEIG